MARAPSTRFGPSSRTSSSAHGASFAPLPHRYDSTSSAAPSYSPFLDDDSNASLIDHHDSSLEKHPPLAARRRSTFLNDAVPSAMTGKMKAPSGSCGHLHYSTAVARWSQPGEDGEQAYRDGFRVGGSSFAVGFSSRASASMMRLTRNDRRASRRKVSAKPACEAFATPISLRFLPQPSSPLPPGVPCHTRSRSHNLSHRLQTQSRRLLCEALGQKRSRRPGSARTSGVDLSKLARPCWRAVTGLIDI